MSRRNSSRAGWRDPAVWAADPAIAAAAMDSGWDHFTGDSTLLAAIIATETDGYPRVVSSDDCVGLVQYNPDNQLRFERDRRYGPRIREVLEKHGIERPGVQDLDSWRRDPRASIVYAGFVLQANLDMLRGDRRNNLLLTLQGYNGGNNDLRTPGAVDSQAREYPEAVGAYFQYHATHGTAEERAPFQRALDRLLTDAETVGQRGRIEAGIRQHLPRVEAREAQHRTSAPAPSYNGQAQAASVFSTAPSAGNFNAQDMETLHTIAEQLWCSETAPSGIALIVTPQQRVAVQRALEAAGIATDRGGADGRVDGVLGSRTVAGIRKLEAALGLTQDGVLGTAEWQALQDPQFQRALRTMVLDTTPETPALAAPAPTAPNMSTALNLLAGRTRS